MEQTKILNKVIIVKQEPEANKYLPNPLIVGEKVLWLKFMENKQYIQIRHNKGKSVSSFHRRYFDFAPK